MIKVATICQQALGVCDTELADDEDEYSKIECASTIVSFLSAVAGSINTFIISPEVYDIHMPLSCEYPIDIIEAYLRISCVEDVYLPSYYSNYIDTSLAKPIRLSVEEASTLDSSSLLIKKSNNEYDIVSDARPYMAIPAWRFTPFPLNHPNVDIVNIMPVLRGILCIYGDDYVLDNICKWRFYKP